MDSDARDTYGSDLSAALGILIGTALGLGTWTVLILTTIALTIL